MSLGCVLATAGILLTADYIGPDVTFWPLALALALAGAGFGLAIVPATAAVLAAVPSQRSGMAASTINTSRQIGAVAGVAVLGSLVNAHLTGDLRVQLKTLGVPASFQSIVIQAIKQGSVPTGTSTASVTAQYGGLVIKVLDAAYEAFLDGLRTSLEVAAVAIMLAAAIAWWTNRPGSSGHSDTSDPTHSAALD
jgi:MFS family permease